MQDGQPDSKELGYYVALGQVGVEMVIPIVIGLGLDRYLGWTPWGVVGGAVFGLVFGLIHLVTMVNRHDRERTSKRR